MNDIVSSVATLQQIYNILLFRSYCWIHGTAYIRPHLQGKATGCFVDQSKIESPEVCTFFMITPLLRWKKMAAAFLKAKLFYN